MGYFTLIREKKYKEFCELYLEKGHLRKIQPLEYGDVDAGNYVFALLGLQDYTTAVQICQEEIRKEQQESTKYDMSKSFFWIGLSIAYFMQREYAMAADSIRAATKTAYQDIARTQAPCIMYYESVIIGDNQLLKESKKILNSRLRSKGSERVEFATARFLTKKINSEQMLSQISNDNADSLHYKHLMEALFYTAVKYYEVGDVEKCQKSLHNACELYNTNTVVAMMYEYYLAESWLKELST